MPGTKRSKIPGVIKKGYFKYLRSKGNRTLDIHGFSTIVRYIKEATGRKRFQLTSSKVIFGLNAEYDVPKWMIDILNIEHNYGFTSYLYGGKYTHRDLMKELRRFGCRP